MDLYNMRESPRISAWMGVTLVAALLAIVAVAVADFNHAFSRDVVVTAHLPSQGAVVSANSSVYFRGVEVGKVIDAPHAVPGGEIEVSLRLDRARVDEIPDTVRVVVGPLSVFGNQYVNLVTQGDSNGDTSQLAAAPVRAGATIPAVSDAEAPSLQGTFTSLDAVLRSVHPAQLNAGLSGLAQALSGEGQSLGRTLDSADTYLTEMLPLWPPLVKDLHDFAPFATMLAQSAPDFLDLLKNVTVTSKTLVKQRADFADLLANGGAVSTQVATLISQTMNAYGHAIGGAEVLLNALSQGPAVINKLLAGINQFAGAWSKTIHDGSINVTTKTLNVTNPAQLALALVSGEEIPARVAKAIPGLQVNPPTYTSADCPRYGSVRAHCGGAK